MREARYGGLLFDAYRRRPPAVILNIEVPYWTPEGGYARHQPSVCWLREIDQRAAAARLVVTSYRSHSAAGMELDTWSPDQAFLRGPVRPLDRPTTQRRRDNEP